MYLLAFAMFFVVAMGISRNIHLSTDVSPEKGLYTTTLHLGKPIKPLKFQVSFKLNEQLLFYDPKDQSISYSYDVPSELFYFGSKAYRLAVRVGNSSERATHLSCTDCKGILGLGPDSVYWDIWPSISFSYGGIHLGDDKDSFLMDLNPEDKKRYCELEKLECQQDTIGICTTEALYKNTSYRLRFDGDHPYLYVPRAVYQDYFSNKNVYRDTLSDWAPLQFTIPAKHFHSLHSICDHDDEFQAEGGYQFEFDANELLYVEHDGTARIMVKPNPRENDTIELGIQVWRRFMIRKTTAFSNNGHILLKKNMVKQHANNFNLFLIILLAISWIRWNLTGMPGHFVLDIENGIYYATEFATMIIGIIACSLNSTTSILLPDYTAMYVLSVIAIGFSIVAEVISLVVFYRLPQLDRQKLAELHSWFLCNIVRNVAHQMIIAVSIMLLVVEQRSESIAIILTVIASLIAIYLMFYYLYGITAYFMYIFYDRKKLPEITVDQKIVSSAVLIFIVAAVVYVLVVSRLFFLNPFLERIAGIYIDLVPLAIYIAYIALIIAAIMSYTLHHHQQIRIGFHRHHKMLLQKKAKRDLKTLRNVVIEDKPFIKGKNDSVVHRTSYANKMLEHHTTDSLQNLLDNVSNF
jgi:hypothetical protein